MLYTKQQVEVMLVAARLFKTPFNEIIDEQTPVYLPDEDEINDAAYDEVGPDNMDHFKEGGAWVNDIIAARANRVDENIKERYNSI